MHLMSGDRPAGDDGDRLLDAERRLAGAGRRHLDRHVAAQQGAFQQPAPAGQHRDVELLEEVRRQRWQKVCRVDDLVFRVGDVPLRPAALDHASDLAPGLIDGVAGQRERLGGGQDLGIGPSAGDPVAGQAHEMVVPVVAGSDRGEACLDRDAVELAADVQGSAALRIRRRIGPLGTDRRERFCQLARKVDLGPTIVEGVELGALNGAAGLGRPGDRAGEAQHATRIDHRRVAAERQGQGPVLPAADLGIALRGLQAPPGLRTLVRLPSGHHDGGRRATPFTIEVARCLDPLIEVGIEGGQREEVVIAAATRDRGAGPAQGSADIDVLARNTVQLEGPVDQAVQLIRAIEHRMAEAVVGGIGPGELDQPLMAAIEVAAEQMLHMAEHLSGVRLEDRAHVVVHGGIRPELAWTCDQHRRLRTRPPSGDRCWPARQAREAARARPAAGRSQPARPATPPMGSTGLWSGSSAGRSTHFTISSFGR